MTTLTARQTAKLARLQNRDTLYELVAEKAGRRLLAGYCQRSRRGLLDMVRKNGQNWVRLTGASHFDYEPKAAEGIRIGGWRIRFSGRTEREAIMSGELPWFADSIAKQDR